MKRERVIGLSGEVKGREYDIVKSLSIGRNPESGIQLFDRQISRKHAEIERTEAGSILRDLASGNGTFVGGRRILEYRLSDGDVFKMGDSEFKFEVYEVEGSSAVSGVHLEVSGEDENLKASKVEDVYQTFFAAPREAVSAEELQDAQARFAAVYEANKIIASEQDLKKLFERVMDQVSELTKADNGAILLREEGLDELVAEYVTNDNLSVSSTIVRRAFDKGEAVITYNAADDSRFAGGSIVAQNISSAMCAPLIHHNEPLGVLYLDTRGTTNAFTQKDLEVLVALSGPAATAIKNVQYLQKLEKSYRDTLLVLANSIEARDHYTVGHTWRVTNFAKIIAMKMGWSEEKVKECEKGGVLHDVGKIAVADSILGKTSKLTDEEYKEMKIHPEKGARMLQDVEGLHSLIPYCLYHHERYDGKGYPFGIAGEEIPIEGRIIAVADTFDAMTSSRPYRKGLDPEIAIAEIEKNKGTQLDPQCSEMLIACYREGKIDQILQDSCSTEEKSISCPFCSTYVSMPDEAEVGAEIECPVCHRHVILRTTNDVYYGELVPEA